MEKIHILTDSSSDIPHDLVEAHGIEIVPIMLTHEGRSFREYYDITSEDYCRLLETSSEIPGTAMTTPTVFLESYNRAFERGCTHLLAVLINGGGSGTYQAACLAKSMFEEEQGEGKMTIEVIDSKTYTYIYGHIVVKAAEMREQGESFDAIVSVVKAVLTAWKPTSVCTASSSSRSPAVFRAARPSWGRRSVSSPSAMCMTVR